jgi:hypothetical protein
VFRLTLVAAGMPSGTGPSIDERSDLPICVLDSGCMTGNDSRRDDAPE